MGRKIDVGGYFEQITKGARGGRRLGREGSPPPSAPVPQQPAPSSAPKPASGGGLKDRLRDILGGPRGRQPQTAPTRPTSPTTPSRRTELPREGVVSIEYSPQMDGDPDPGDVVWVWVPFEEDPTQGKDRPLVVIGRRGKKLVGVPLTTKPDPNEAQVEVGVGDWDPKRRVSYARLWRMRDIDPSEMRREGAVLDRPRFDVLVKAIDQYYDITLPAARPGKPGKTGEIDFDY